MDQWTILSPVAHRVDQQGSSVRYTLDRPIAGARVGLRVDFAWRCFKIVIDEWQQLLEADGAQVFPLWVESERGEVKQYNPDDLRTDIDEWSRLIDCGLAGLGN